MIKTEHGQDVPAAAPCLNIKQNNAKIFGVYM